MKRDDDRRRVVWHFPSTSNATHTFTVTYRAAGVVWQDADSDVLAWTLLPTRHEYAIDCASGEVRYPEGATLVAGATLDPPASEVQHERRSGPLRALPVRAERVVGRDAAVRTGIGGGGGARSGSGGRRSTARTRRCSWGWAGSSCLRAIAGFLMFALNHRHARTDHSGDVSSPPDDLAPALAGSLIGTAASTGWGPVLGAVMDLARRRALTIESVEKTGLFASKEVRISRGPVPAHAAPHERVLLDLLFTDKHGPRTSVTFSELAKTFASSRRWKRLKEAIAAELRDRAPARCRSGAHARPRHCRQA